MWWPVPAERAAAGSTRLRPAFLAWYRAVSAACSRPDPLYVPSETLKYLQEQGDPAGSYPDAEPQRRGGGGRGR